MRAEHYSVGDRVQVSKRSFSGPVTTGQFEVIAQYAVEGAEPMYRLRSLELRTERMVPQRELRRGNYPRVGRKPVAS
jgi:hypothetical protein